MWYLSDDDILPALRLSYNYPPSQLKRCFAYCSLFPKNYKFQKEEVILLWMAEGLLVEPNEKKEMEVGGAYFDDLVSRSFLQESNSYRSCFGLRDLISDSAKYVSGEFCFRFEGDNSCSIEKKTPHFSYLRTKYDALEIFGAIFI